MQRHYALIAAVWLLAGCAPSPEKAAKDARDAAGSWGATVSAAAERWSSGDVSTSYFRSVVAQARAALQQEAQTARASAGASAAAPVDAVASHMDALEDAVTRGDRAAAVTAAHAAATAAPADPIPPVARPE